MPLRTRSRLPPTPKERRVAAPKHCLLHRLTRGSGASPTMGEWTPWRCNSPSCLTLSPAPGIPPLGGVGHRLDDVRHHPPLGQTDALPGVEDRRAEEGTSTAAPLLQSAYDRDNLRARTRARKPDRTRGPFFRAKGAAQECSPRDPGRDRGFHRAGFIAWLRRHHLEYVVRIKKGSCITQTDGRGWKLGEEGLRLGEVCASLRRCATRSLPRPSPRCSDQRGPVLESLEKAGRRILGANDPRSHGIGAMVVFGHQP